ncbi:VOC family protein [Jiella avicenniae]|uniref:VOC family protein n=1 Tax=Jiella avicenniae TaxID=2907202 RepID=A0A9X1P1C3_9HYPH|nr:VOC family protein [Jiella avicenniae]MCE7028276.1 VOC family protein [Jiella avicenniae]
MAPPLAGLLETCLYVDDMARASGFYRRLLGQEPLLAEPRITVFRLADGTVLILFQRGATLEPVEIPGSGAIPPHDGSGPLHFALAIPEGSEDRWRRHLAEIGAAVESEVDWPKGRGLSLYFRDPDGHCGELATRRLWERI